MDQQNNPYRQTLRPDQPNQPYQRPSFNQPQQPYNPQLTPKPPKSRKKLILLITVFALVVVSLLVWFFIFNKHNDNTQSIQPEQNQSFVPEYYIQSGKEIKYIDEKGSLVELPGLEIEDRITEVLERNGEAEIRYVSTEFENGGIAAKSYSSLTAQESRQLFNIPEGFDFNSTNFISSPDGNKILVETYDSEGTMGKITLFDLEEKTNKEIYKNNIQDSTEILKVVDWKDDNTVLMQTQKCSRCADRLPELIALDINSGQTSPFYKTDSLDSQYATFFPLQGTDSIYLIVSDFARMMGGTTDYGDDFIYKINKQTGEGRLIKQISGMKDTDTNTIVGATEDGVYVSTKSFIETTDTNPVMVDTTGSYNPVSKLSVISDNGDMKEVPLETRFLKEKTSIIQIDSYKQGLLIVLSSLNQNGNESVNTNSSYNLILLDSSKEQGEVKDIYSSTISSDAQFRLFKTRQ